MASCEIWVVVDENGDTAACDDREAAEERYRDNITSDAGLALRVVCVTLTIPEPTPLAISGVVPAETMDGATLTLS